MPIHNSGTLECAHTQDSRLFRREGVPPTDETIWSKLEKWYYGVGQVDQSSNRKMRNKKIGEICQELTFSLVSQWDSQWFSVDSQWILAVIISKTGPR